VRIGVAGPASLRLLRDLVDGPPDLPAGYEFPLISELVRGLVARGHRVTLFALDPASRAPKSFVGTNLEIRVVPCRPGKRARDGFRVEREGLQAAMTETRCDVVHAHWTYEFALAALSSPHPCVVTAHDAPLGVLPFMPLAAWPYWLVRVSIAGLVSRRARTVTAVSEYVARHFKRVFRYRREIDVIPNPVADKLLAMQPRSDAPTGQPPVFVSSLTGFSRRKNGILSLRAFSLVRQKVPDARLVLFGSGHGPGEAAERWAQQHRLTSGIDFRGQRPYPEVLSFIREEASAVVHPALEESFSMVAAEAMALGVPVVAYRHAGALSDTLGSAGVLLSNQATPESFAALMERSVTDPSLRTHVSLLGRREALARFRMNEVLSRYERAYASAIAEHSSGLTAS
jgi:glycosyltransferase involved in cell wall biosynthesis